MLDRGGGVGRKTRKKVDISDEELVTEPGELNLKIKGCIPQPQGKR